MDRGYVTIEGTVKPDGTLALDQPVELPPGPVRVTVELLAPVKQDTWQALQRIWAESKALGLNSRSAEEIDAEINALRDESEDELGAIEGLPNDGR